MENKLICGDNLEVLATIEKESVDLIYIDPPFFSNRHYEVVWGDEAEVRSFEDRWEGGIEHYIGWLKERVRLMHDILKPSGSFYLHCDYHANAHIRIMLDKIFGENNFKNEIIWCYTIGGKSKKMFARKHDTIYFYTKSKEWIFNGDDVAIERPKTHMKMNQDSDGRFYQEKKDKKSGKIYKYYIDKGKIPEDYWLGIETLNREDKARMGYPTQKPPELLERIIKASSNENDIVLDAFCGCGTTVIECSKLKRSWIGIDISPTAIKTIEKRLKKYR